MAGQEILAHIGLDTS